MKYRINLRVSDNFLIFTPQNSNLTNINSIQLSFHLTEKNDDLSFWIRFNNQKHTTSGVYKSIIDNFMTKHEDTTFNLKEIGLEIDSGDFISDKEEAQQLLKNFFDSLFKFVDLTPKDKQKFNEYCQEHGLDYQFQTNKSPLLTFSFVAPKENVNATPAQKEEYNDANNLSF